MTSIDGQVPESIHLWANIQIVLIMIPLSLFSTIRYSHTSGTRFSQILSSFNVAAALLSLMIQLLLIIVPEICAFFMHDTISAICEFNLYHYRTAIFYQSNVKFYRFLKYILYLQNFLYLLLNVLGLLTNYHVHRVGLSCSGGIGLGLQVIVIPALFNLIFMLALGYYTICSYWRSANEESTRHMRVMWIMLLSYTLTNLSAFTSIISVMIGAGQYAVFTVYCIDKCVTLSLALIVWYRLRQRQQQKDAGRHAKMTIEPRRIPQSNRHTDSSTSVPYSTTIPPTSPHH